MSKKINITIPNKVRPNLINLFHEYLSRKSKEPRSTIHEPYLWDEDDYEDMAAYWGQMFPGWDDNLDDDSDIVFPPHGDGNIIVMNPQKLKNGKRRDKDKEAYDSYWQQEREEGFGKKSKHKHSKGKKCKTFDITTPYSGEEEEYDFDDIRLQTEDYEPETKHIWFYPDYHCKEDRIEFCTLKDFNDYCDSMGYYVSNEVTNDIIWRYESHCCLNPESERLGLLDIMTAHSYGDMFYDACDEAELGD